MRAGVSMAAISEVSDGEKVSENQTANDKEELSKRLIRLCKGGDRAGGRELLREGVDPNYVEKTPVTFSFAKQNDAGTYLVSGKKPVKSQHSLLQLTKVIIKSLKH